MSRHCLSACCVVSLLVQFVITWHRYMLTDRGVDAVSGDALITQLINC